MGTAYPYSHQGGAVQPETRSLEELYHDALAEGGIVTLWHGGDEKNQQDNFKAAFEKQFPGVTMNLTVDVSKYLSPKIEEQLIRDQLYVDVAMLQTLQDFPRWKEEGALAPYKPADFEKVYSKLRDPEGHYMGVRFFHLPITWDVSSFNGKGPMEHTDLLKPEYKDKLVLTYPNDDDAVLFGFDQIVKQYGVSWFDALLAQNPSWVRGTQTPSTIIINPNGTKTATFTSVGFPASSGNLRAVLPQEGSFTSWAQRGAIFARAPHPAAARLLMSFALSREWQEETLEFGWSVREDLPNPNGFNKSLMDMDNTSPLAFYDFMMDRPMVENTRFWYESRLGTAQGLDPVADDV